MRASRARDAGTPRIRVPDARVAEVLELVGLTDAQERRVGAIPWECVNAGLAAALLGDPPTIVLDEPANGLDPRGIRWLRLLRDLAA